MIEAERLILRPFTPKDMADMIAYTNAQTVHCFLCMHIPDLEAAQKELAERAKDTEYYFAICLKESDRVIGEIFAHPEATDPTQEAADTFCPCWMLHPDYQGQGYALEAAGAYFDYLFCQKGGRRIYIYTEEDNIPCQRLCQKLGMRKEGEFREFVSFVRNPDGSPLYENTWQYAILKSEWIRRKI